MLSYLKTLFTVNTKNLGVLRIGLALILGADLIQKIAYHQLWFTNSGIVTPETASQLVSVSQILSVHTISGDPNYFITLLIFQLLILLVWGLGYKTKTTTIVVRYMTYSLWAANSLLANNWDMISHMVLFRMMFLPLGAVSIFGPKQKKHKNIISLASIGLILSIIIMYSFTGISRIVNPESNELRLWYTLNNSNLSKRISQYLISKSEQNIWILLGHMVNLRETGRWILLGRKKTRNKALSCTMLFHVGIFSLMKVFKLSLGMIIVLLGLVIQRKKQTTWSGTNETTTLFLTVMISFLLIINSTQFINSKTTLELPNRTSNRTTGLKKFQAITTINSNTRGMFWGINADMLRYTVIGIDKNGTKMNLFNNTEIKNITDKEQKHYRNEAERFIFEALHNDNSLAEKIIRGYCLNTVDSKSITIYQISQNYNNNKKGFERPYIKKNRTNNCKEIKQVEKN